MGSQESTAVNLEALGRGLAELGYVEGATYVVEARYGDGREERYPELAAELVRLDMDVIVTGGSAAIRALGQATATIPIVFAATADPVADGVVASLARPGGNITGLTTYAGEEHAKRLELLKDAVPSVSRVAVLWNQSAVRNFRDTEAAARGLGVEILSLELRSPDEIETVLARAITGRADGLLIVGGTALGFVAPRIAALAAQHRLPAMYSNSPFADAGGLMIYAANAPENYQRAAAYADKILKGAKPGDLPVEQPSRFDFVVNLNTAQALGVTIPQSVLAQATEIIQ